jgi:hypothetical protein
MFHNIKNLKKRTLLLIVLGIFVLIDSFIYILVPPLDYYTEFAGGLFLFAFFYVCIANLFLMRFFAGVFRKALLIILAIALTIFSPLIFILFPVTLSPIPYIQAFRILPIVVATYHYASSKGRFPDKLEQLYPKYYPFRLLEKDFSYNMWFSSRPGHFSLGSYTVGYKTRITYMGNFLRGYWELNSEGTRLPFVLPPYFPISFHYSVDPRLVGVWRHPLSSNVSQVKRDTLLKNATNPEFVFEFTETTFTFRRPRRA